MQGQGAELPHALREHVSHGEDLVGLLVEKQVVVAEVRPAHVPMEVLRLQVERKRVGEGAVANDVGIDCGAFSGGVKVSAQAARSMGGSVGFSASVGQPSTFLMVIWPDASSAQNSMAAVSAEGRTV